jgi:hypothetical protein
MGKPSRLFSNLSSVPTRIVNGGRFTSPLSLPRGFFPTSGDDLLNRVSDSFLSSHLTSNSIPTDLGIRRNIAKERKSVAVATPLNVRRGPLPSTSSCSESSRVANVATTSTPQPVSTNGGTPSERQLISQLLSQFKNKADVRAYLKVCSFFFFNFSFFFPFFFSYLFFFLFQLSSIMDLLLHNALQLFVFLVMY